MYQTEDMAVDRQLKLLYHGTPDEVLAWLRGNPSMHDDAQVRYAGTDVYVSVERYVSVKEKNR